MGYSLIAQNTGLSFAGLGCGITDISVKPSIMGGEQMRVMLDNGYELSILAGGFGAYTKGDTFEVATIVTGGCITELFDEFGDGVYGFLTHTEVGELLRRVSYLKSPQNALKS